MQMAGMVNINGIITCKKTMLCTFKEISPFKNSGIYYLINTWKTVLLSFNPTQTYLEITELPESFF